MRVENRRSNKQQEFEMALLDAAIFWRRLSQLHRSFMCDQKWQTDALSIPLEVTSEEPSFNKLVPNLLLSS